MVDKMNQTLMVSPFFVEYHNELVQNGVCDYDWSRFLLDFEKALVERVVGNIK